MYKFVSPLKKSILIVFSLHLLAFILLFFTAKISQPDIFRVIPITLSISLIVIFFSILFFENSQNKRRGFLLMSVTIFVLCLFVTNFIDKNYLVLLHIKGFIIGLLGVAFGALSFLIQVLIAKDKSVSDDKKGLVKYSLKQIILIPLSGVIFYSIIIYIGSSYSFNILTVWTELFPIGFLTTFIAFHFLNKIYSKGLEVNRTRNIFLLYLTILTLLVSFLIFSSEAFYLFKGNMVSRITMIAIPIIILHLPYIIYVILLTHFYYLKKLDNQEKEELKQKSLASEINYSLLKKQLSPHFLFNNINVLTGLIEESPYKAIEFSQSLSNVYRYFLDNEKNDVIKLKDEIKFAESYLELMRMRFEDGVQLRLDVNEEALEKYILTNSLQQVLENIFKHNEVSYEVPMEIEICSENNYLQIKNKKNKRYSEFIRRGIGINNIMKRYAFISNSEVEIEESENLYIIRLPLLSD